MKLLLPTIGAILAAMAIKELLKQITLAKIENRLHEENFLHPSKMCPN